jgi:hypothetical protein
MMWKNLWVWHEKYSKLILILSVVKVTLIMPTLKWLKSFPKSLHCIIATLLRFYLKISVEIKKRNKELKGILNIFFELKKSKLFFKFLPDSHSWKWSSSKEVVHSIIYVSNIIPKHTHTNAIQLCLRKNWGMMSERERERKRETERIWERLWECVRERLTITLSCV